MIVPAYIRALLAVLAVASTATAADAPTKPDEVARRIDQRLADKQLSRQVRAATLVDDATLIRRLSLDLIGRIPTVAETREFVEDRHEAKYRELVRRLIDSPQYARHWALVWRRHWIPQADTPQFEFLAQDVDPWLSAELQSRTPHDRLVKNLILGSSTGERRGEQGATRAFLVASENKPENLAAHATRAFLGINLDCAQCHDHPFASWTRDQFWQTAAFFARPSASESAASPFIVTIAETDRVVAARFLTAEVPSWPTRLEPDSGRRALADWVTSRDNAFFAKNVVNTVWLQLFGRGLVEPLDDLTAKEPQGDPQLLGTLAEYLIQTDFDTAKLVEACVLTEAYRRDVDGATSAEDGKSTFDVDRFLFAQHAVRALSGEQAYDSLRTAAGLPVLRDDLSRRDAVIERRAWGLQFLTDRPIAAERSILQALQLMNGRLTQVAADAEQGPLVVAAAEAPFESLAERVDVLFWAAFNRQPSAEERAAAVAHLESTGNRDLRAAVADVFWALINTAEFNTNH